MFRIKKEENFVMLDKGFLESNRLSFKAKGILAYLLSKPDDWKVYESEIAKHTTEGIKSVRSGVKELIDEGYISRRMKRNDGGKFEGYEYVVYERPTVMPKTENGFSENGKWHTTNIDLTKNDISNNKRINNTSILVKSTNSYFLDDYDSNYNDDIREVLDYYYKAYKFYEEKEHPKLKREQLQRIYEVIEWGICEHCYESFEPMIGEYFEKVKNTDYNLNHFATEGIINILIERVK